MAQPVLMGRAVSCPYFNAPRTVRPVSGWLGKPVGPAAAVQVQRDMPDPGMERGSGLPHAIILQRVVRSLHAQYGSIPHTRHLRAVAYSSQ
jgi:hypothetical protein